MTAQTKMAPSGRNDRSEEPATIEPKGARSKTTPVEAIDQGILRDVEVTLESCLGRAELSVQELLEMKSGSVIKLDVRLNEPVELRLQGSLIARGEIVAVGDHFGLRIVEIGKAK
jgi:flagellar motor switch protein FliN/FliY